MLCDLARIHHNDVITGLGDHCQVMGDHNDRHTHVFLKFFDQFQDLRLNRHIKSGCGFIGYQQIWSTGQCHGDDHTLSHAARQLVGVLIHADVG